MQQTNLLIKISVAKSNKKRKKHVFPKKNNINSELHATLIAMISGVTPIK